MQYVGLEYISCGDRSRGGRSQACGRMSARWCSGCVMETVTSCVTRPAGGFSCRSLITHYTQWLQTEAKCGQQIFFFLHCKKEWRKREVAFSTRCFWLMFISHVAFFGFFFFFFFLLLVFPPNCINVWFDNIIPLFFHTRTSPLMCVE